MPPAAQWIQDATLDANMRRLVAALNAFPGTRTIGSCGGHDNPTPDQWPAGRWYVKFEVARGDDGWFALEFLAWLVNNDYRRAGHQVILLPTAAPPYLNEPGRCLHWALEGDDGEDADALAAWIDELRGTSFVSPEAARGAAPVPPKPVPPKPVAPHARRPALAGSASARPAEQGIPPPPAPTARVPAGSSPRANAPR